ncbi:MAG: hypothetical protein K9I82_06945 [Chitinophagaceae bacterium]|nr:hypothetical protein [Chitinophagaceae bacterium]
MKQKSIQHKSIVVISWDGISTPLSYVFKDTAPDFDLFIFDYSGQDNASKLEALQPAFYLSQQTECKGDILQGVYTYLLQNKVNDFKYIGLLDDDIFISYSDLNKLLFIANMEGLDVFQASLSHDSYYHHRQFIQKAGNVIIPTNWVEIMAPFYSNEVFFEAGKDFNRSISGTGIDVYLIPTVQVLLNKTKTAVVHAVSMKHCRPIRTDNRIFRNGKDNLTEIAELQTYCMDIVKQDPTKFSVAFVHDVIHRKYVYGIPLKYKLKRLPTLFTNLYRLLVDESYR